MKKTIRQLFDENVKLCLRLEQKYSQLLGRFAPIWEKHLHRIGDKVDSIDKDRVEEWTVKDLRFVKAELLKLKAELKSHAKNKSQNA